MKSFLLWRQQQHFRAARAAPAREDETREGGSQRLTGVREPDLKARGHADAVADALGAISTALIGLKGGGRWRERQQANSPGTNTVRDGSFGDARRSGSRARAQRETPRAARARGEESPGWGDAREDARPSLSSTSPCRLLTQPPSSNLQQNSSRAGSNLLWPGRGRRIYEPPVWGRRALLVNGLLSVRPSSSSLAAAGQRPAGTAEPGARGEEQGWQQGRRARRDARSAVCRLGLGDGPQA